MLHPLAARNGFCFVLTCFALTMTIPSASQTSTAAKPDPHLRPTFCGRLRCNLPADYSAPPRLRVCSLFSL